MLFKVTNSETFRSKAKLSFVFEEILTTFMGKVFTSKKLSYVRLVCCTLNTNFYST